MGSMKAPTAYLEMKTRERDQMVHVMPKVDEIVRQSGIDDGLCFVR